MVVIPVYNQLELTKTVVGALRAEKHNIDALLIYDNGSTDETWEWLDSQHDVSSYRRPDANIYQLWNEGWQWALETYPGEFNLALLNNDLIFLTPEPIGELTKALRAQPDWGGVGPVEPAPHLQPEPEQIHVARRSGYLPGWCMVIKGELAREGLPMADEGFSWWYGDNDLYLNIEKLNYQLGICHWVKMNHLCSASSVDTSDHRIAHLLARAGTDDKERFFKKWRAGA